MYDISFEPQWPEELTSEEISELAPPGDEIFMHEYAYAPPGGEIFMHEYLVARGS